MNRVILKLLMRRVALALLSLLAVSVIVFSITAVLPGDAAPDVPLRELASVGLPLR